MPGPNFTVRSSRIMSLALDSDSGVGTYNRFNDGNWYFGGQLLVDVTDNNGEFDRLVLRRLGTYANSDSFEYAIEGGTAAQGATLAAATASLTDPAHGTDPVDLGVDSNYASAGWGMNLRLYSPTQETAATPVVVNFGDFSLLQSTTGFDTYVATVSTGITAPGTNRLLGRVALSSISLDNLLTTAGTTAPTFSVNNNADGNLGNTVSSFWNDGVQMRANGAAKNLSNTLNIVAYCSPGSGGPSTGSVTVGWSEFAGIAAPTGNEALLIRAHIEDQQ